MFCCVAFFEGPRFCVPKPPGGRKSLSSLVLFLLPCGHSAAPSDLEFAEAAAPVVRDGLRVALLALPTGKADSVLLSRWPRPHALVAMS